MSTTGYSQAASIGKGEIMRPWPRVASPAHRIADDREALAVAREMAARFAPGAAARDRDRVLPFAELDVYSQSGLWGISIPRSHGGAGVSYATLAECTAIVSAADPSIGQIPQNHYYMVEALRLDGTPEQQRFFFDCVLNGDRFGNAFTEVGTRTILDLKTRVSASGTGFVLNGRKYYSTGAIYAHWVPVVAFNDDNQIVVAFARRDAEGLTLIDDWTCMGQRGTASGSALFENVALKAHDILLHQAAFDRPTPMGPVAQILHAAVDTGIARAALADTIHFVRHYTRPWIDSGQDHGYEDMYSIAMIGDLQMRVHATDALLERAGHAIDRAAVAPDDDSVAQASVAVAEAKAMSTEVSILVTNKLFELAGTRATLEEYNLHRHWRNARAHTLHDPVRWKFHAIGNYALNGIRPPRNGTL